MLSLHLITSTAQTGDWGQTGLLLVLILRRQLPTIRFREIRRLCSRRHFGVPILSGRINRVRRLTQELPEMTLMRESGFWSGLQAPLLGTDVNGSMARCIYRNTQERPRLPRLLQVLLV